jgi:hypothetical protein
MLGMDTIMRRRQLVLDRYPDHYVKSEESLRVELSQMLKEAIEVI